MLSGNVRPRVRPLDDAEFRELLSPALEALCEDVGRIEVAGTIECDPKTVSNARYERATLGAPSTFNLLLLDTTALNPILARYGLVAAPIEAGDDEDDAYFAELEDELVEVLSLAAKSRRAVGRLCHRTKAGMLKAWDRASRARAKIKRGVA